MAHLAPLLINEKTKEPYLPLPHPHSNIIITPPRQVDADIEAITRHLNDLRVVKWLDGPPYPYTENDAKKWLEGVSRRAQDILRDLKEKPGAMVGGCPVRILREVKENGEDVFLGDCGIDLHMLFEEVEDPVERKKMIDENTNRLPGDPETVWDIGDYLAASHHGKGIMTAALRTLIKEWFIPRMGTKNIYGIVFEGNYGSTRVFEKNGFVLDPTYKGRPREIAAGKGGGWTGVQMLRWRP